jgi:hypothetical protein
MLRVLGIVVFATLIGCSSSTAAGDGEAAAPAAGAAPAPEVSPPGAPAGPPPNAGLPPSSGHSIPDSFDLRPGQGVTVSGTIAYDGGVEGKIYVDVLQKTTAGDGAALQVRILHIEQVEALGAWSFEVPRNLGEVSLMGFVDVDDNGPSGQDPQMVYDGVSVAEGAVSGIELQLLLPSMVESEVNALPPGATLLPGVPVRD